MKEKGATIIDHDNTKDSPSPSWQPASSLSAPSNSNPLPRYVDLYLDFEEEKNPDGTLVTPRRARCRLCLKDWRWKDRRATLMGMDSACILDEGEEFVIDRGVLGEGDEGMIKMHALIRYEVEKYRRELVEWGVI